MLNPKTLKGPQNSRDVILLEKKKSLPGNTDTVVRAGFHQKSHISTFSHQQIKVPDPKWRHWPHLRHDTTPTHFFIDNWWILLNVVKNLLINNNFPICGLFVACFCFVWKNIRLTMSRFPGRHWPGTQISALSARILGVFTCQKGKNQWKSIRSGKVQIWKVCASV